MHDYNLKRLAGINKKVQDMTYNELVGLPISQSGHTSRIPSFEEYVKRAKELNIKLVVELKPHGGEPNNYVDIFIEKVKELDIENNYKYMSLDLKVMKELESKAPQLETGYIIPFQFGKFSNNNVDFFAIEDFSFSNTLVEQAKSQNKSVYVWTINDPSLITKYLQSPANGIITDEPVQVRETKEKLEKKILDFKNKKYNFKFAEFGCRRRLSREWQEEVVKKLSSETQNIVGTSNVFLAMKYNLVPIGTYAHEYVQMYQGIDSIPLSYTNHYALKDWYDEYKGDNGTALTDTITTDLFLRDFDRSMVNNYTGVRHDSGDPYIWAEKILNHYEKYGIDPKTKTLLFSDSLNFDEAEKIYQTFKDKVKISFGIGTFVTNDTKEKPLNIVIKLQYVNGRPVAKLSDVEGKVMCDDEKYLKYLKASVKFRLEREKEY